MTASTNLSILPLDRSLTWIAVTLIALFLYVLFTAIRSISFHPLSSIPGPKLAAATQLPIANFIQNGTLSQWLLSLHERYSSDIVRISPNEISIISPTAWKDVYSHRQGQPNFPKDVAIYAGEKSIVTANDADHSRMRRLLSHAFSDKALKEQEKILQTHVDELVNGLKGIMRQGRAESTREDDDSIRTKLGLMQGKTDLVDWYQWIAFDNIGDLSFGESFHCLTHERYHPWVESLKLALKFVAYMSVIIRFPPLKSLLKVFLMTKPAREGRAALRQLATDQVVKRMNLETTRADFMSYIMAHNDTKLGLTQEEINLSAQTFIGAGSETTAGILCGFTWYTLRNKECYKRVRDEVRAACQTREDVNIQNIEDLEYLNAVINETFRIYPTALAGQPRIVPAGGAVICGRHIPGGTGLQMNQFAAFNSSLNFAEPSTFAPERWLEKKNDIYMSDKTDVLQPFSVGPRNCIGKNLAMAEIRLILARMLWEFNMELCAETSEDWANQRAWLTWEQKPLIMRLTAAR